MPARERNLEGSVSSRLRDVRDLKVAEELAGNTILILGGANSGKSRFAEKLAEESGFARAFIATGQALDSEMADRIARHRDRRGTDWVTVEAPLQLARALREEARPGRILLVDCLTLWISNLMMADADCERESQMLVETIGNMESDILIVSNEVGLGIVPDNATAREFRDRAGRLNQLVAACASQVYFIAAGIPIRLKPNRQDI